MEQFTFPALEGDRVQPTGPTREHILAAARAEAGTIAAEAHTNGHNEGYAAGMAEAQTQLEPARAALVEACTALERMAGELARAFKDPQFVANMQKAGLEPAADPSPAEFSAFIAKEIARWGEAVKIAGVTLQ